MKPIDVLFMSQKDVVGLGLAVQDVVAQVEQALREHAAGTYEMHPKIGVHPTGTHPANFIHAMPAYLKGMGTCGLKWVSGFANNPGRDLPNITGVQIHNDTDTGVPLAIMDCSYLTGLRTAAVSAIAARLGARAGAETLALAGCGFQGTMHLWFITTLIPTLRTVRLIDVRRESAVALAKQAATYFKGEIIVCDRNEQCLRDADVIATCTNGDDQIIVPEWFKPGAFGVGIEGGCAYTAEALHQADKFLVDDIPLTKYFDELARNRVKADGTPDPEYPGGLPPIYATLGELSAGKKPARESDTERIITVPIGMAICDIPLGRLVYEKARAQGAGKTLNLM